jgi:transcription initiation factor TFIIIB Brf1 subunit/transcription initiation factor TFIIB
MIEKVPRTPQATATVSEIARISRAAIDRSLNMGIPKLRVTMSSENPRKYLIKMVHLP